MVLNIIYAVGVLLIAVGVGASLRRHRAGSLISAAGAVVLAVHNVINQHWLLVAAWAVLAALSVLSYVKAARRAREAR